MADKSLIEWTDTTWQIVTGCSVVSPGCTNCYAMRLAGGRMQHHPSRVGLTTETKAGPVWNGQVRFNEAWLTQPLGWKKPRKIFVAAHGDLFHEGVTDAQLDQVFAVMALCPQHVFQVLTKRAARMRDYLANDPIGRTLAWADEVVELSTITPPSATDAVMRAQDDLAEGNTALPNVWLGVSVEDQARADERIPDLLATPAAVRWISAEPLLGPVDLFAFTNAAPGNVGTQGDAPRSDDCSAVTSGQAGCGSVVADPHPRIDWVVLGGESGPAARPMHPDWARQIRDQCAKTGVAFLFKQWGAWSPVTVEGDPEWATIDQGPIDPRPLEPRDSCLLYADGRREDDQGMAWPDAEPRQMLLIGKGRAGRHLDGVLHDGYPS